MKISIVAVMSANGLITSHSLGEPQYWASKEDQNGFTAMIRASDAVIMGRKTYDTIQDALHLRPKVLRIVMTSRPARYSHVSGKGILEFTDKKPADIIADLQARGCRSILLAGGASLHSLFLHEHVVTDLYITVEPYIFGGGVPFARKFPDTIKLDLVRVHRLNTQGSLLLHYKFLKII